MPDDAEEYCILCGGPCREPAIQALASKKIGEQMDRVLREYDLPDGSIGRSLDA